MMRDLQPSWYIFGPGALGLGIAGLLSLKAGYKPLLWRGPVTSGNQPGGSRQLMVEGATFTFPVDHRPLRELDLPSVAGILVTTKAWAVREVLTSIARSIHLSKVPVIVLANGYVWRHAAEFAENLPLLRFGAARMAVRESAAKQFRVVTPEGPIVWGSLRHIDDPAGVRPTAVEQELFSTFPNWQWSMDIGAALQEKWLMNAVINPLCAKHRLPKNGDLMERRTEVEMLLAECYHLGAVRWGHWPKSIPDYSTALWQLVESTKANENSMARDARLGQRTELLDLFPDITSTRSSEFPLITQLLAQ